MANEIRSINSSEKDFLISSDQCRILSLLDSTGSLRKAACALNRDVSVLSRQINQISKIAPLVEKINGKWQVSPLGKKMSNWASDAILAQQKILEKQEHLTIVTTGEFSGRVLGPKLGEIFKKEDDFQITILMATQGIEKHLLSGEADIGLGCGRPTDPAIKFHKIVTEPFIIVAAPKLLGKRQICNLEDLVALPYIRHTDFDAGKYLDLSKDLLKVQASFNHLSGIRGACIGGLGWAILPRYSVQTELDRYDLVELTLKNVQGLENDYYGIWWLRDRRNIDPFVRTLTSWLKQLKL